MRSVCGLFMGSRIVVVLIWMVLWLVVMVICCGFCRCVAGVVVVLCRMIVCRSVSMVRFACFKSSRAFSVMYVIVFVSGLMRRKERLLFWKSMLM